MSSLPIRPRVCSYSLLGVVILACLCSFSDALLRGTSISGLQTEAADEGSSSTIGYFHAVQRRAMKDEEYTKPPTLAPSASPTAVLSQSPTPEPVTLTEEFPSEVPAESPVSISEDDPNSLIRSLVPFSLKVEGELDDERLFRRDLELYLLNEMKESLPALRDISLEPTPSELGRRSLQQATLLQYEGNATLFEDASNRPSTQQVQAIQTRALEKRRGQALQGFFQESSTQPLSFLELQIDDRPVVTVQEASLPNGGNRDIKGDGKDKNIGGIVAGVIVALVVVVAVAIIAFFVHREHKKPPPPPPYEFQEASEQESAVGTVEDLNKSLNIQTMETADESLANSPNISIQPSGGDGMEVQLSLDAKVIDLTKPAKHNTGIDAVIEEVKGSPATTEAASPTPPDFKSRSTSPQAAKTKSVSTTVSPFASTNPRSIPTKNNSATEIVSSPSTDADSTAFGMSVIESSISHDDDDDSMAGYSLASLKSNKIKPKESTGSYLTTQKKPAALSTKTQNSSLEPPSRSLPTATAGASVTANPQIKWFQQPRMKPIQKGNAEGFISSDSESNVTLEDVANPLRSSVTGQAQADLFVDNEDDSDSVREEDMYSSVVEDDSAKDESSLALSDSDSAGGVYTTPGQTTGVSPLRGKHGALGYFHQDEEDMDNYDILPVVTPTKNSTGGDNLSEVPSDERNNGTPEQDLTGFNANAIQKGLDELMGPDSSKGPNTRGADLEYSHIIPTEGSWEENPERMETWVKERRRIKRAARSKRADRKQPPVTMEV